MCLLAEHSVKKKQQEQHNNENNKKNNKKNNKRNSGERKIQNIHATQIFMFNTKRGWSVQCDFFF